MDICAGRPPEATRPETSRRCMSMRRPGPPCWRLSRHAPASTTSPNRTDISLRRRRGESWASTPAFGSTLTLDHRSPAESDALVALATPNPVKGPAERGNDSAHKMPCMSVLHHLSIRAKLARNVGPHGPPHYAATSSLMQTGDLELMCAKCFGTRAWRWRCDMLTCQARNQPRVLAGEPFRYPASR